MSQYKPFHKPVNTATFPDLEQLANIKPMLKHRKSFERLQVGHFNPLLHQLVYPRKICTEDALILTLHTISEHLVLYVKKLCQRHIH